MNFVGEQDRLSIFTDSALGIEWEQVDTVHRITGIQEVVDRDHAIALEIQGDKIGRRFERDLAVVYEHRGPAIDNARRVSPLFGSCIGSVVLPDLALSLLV